MTDGLPEDEIEGRTDTQRPAEWLTMRRFSPSVDGGGFPSMDEDADGDWAYIYDCKNAILVYYVVLDYIQQTGSPPGKNEYWRKRFNDALDA